MAIRDGKWMDREYLTIGVVLFVGGVLISAWGFTQATDRLHYVNPDLYDAYSAGAFICLLFAIMGAGFAAYGFASKSEPDLQRQPQSMPYAPSGQYQQPVQQPQGVIQFCPYCGNPLRGMRVCTQCGRVPPR